MKKFFFMMMAVVLFSSCQGQEKEELRLGVCSRNGNNNIRGWVRCGVPVHSLSAKEISILAEDISQIAETGQSPRAIKSQIKERIYEVGGSDISFKIKIGEKMIQRDAGAVNSFKTWILIVLLLSPLMYLSCRK